MVTYSALISACEKGQELRRAFDVCAEMRRQALEPNMVTYSASISACGQGQELRRAFDVCAKCDAELWRPTWSPTVL